LQGKLEKLITSEN